MQEIIENTNKKIELAINSLKEKLTSIIATGASPVMLKNIEVNYYDTMTPINQIANIQAKDATMLIVSPFEKSLNKLIVEAINKANIGLNPVDEGDKIRIMVPPMTEEKRNLFVKDAKSIGEQTRILIRNIRTESNKKIKSAESSENETKLFEEKIQKIIDESNKLVEDIISKKVNDLKTI